MRSKGYSTWFDPTWHWNWQVVQSIGCEQLWFLPLPTNICIRTSRRIWHCTASIGVCLERCRAGPFFQPHNLWFLPKIFHWWDEMVHDIQLSIFLCCIYGQYCFCTCKKPLNITLWIAHYHLLYNFPMPITVFGMYIPRLQNYSYTFV